MPVDTSGEEMMVFTFLELAQMASGAQKLIEAVHRLETVAIVASGERAESVRDYSEMLLGDIEKSIEKINKAAGHQLDVDDSEWESF
jgi:hypothetical protein